MNFPLIKMETFSGDEISTLIKEKEIQIINEIESYKENIFSVVVNDVINEIVEKYKIVYPEIHFSEQRIDMEDIQLPADQFPMDYHFMPGTKYGKTNEIMLLMPFEGDFSFLQYSSSNSSSTHNKPPVHKKGDFLVLSRYQFNKTQEDIHKITAKPISHSKEVVPILDSNN